MAHKGGLNLNVAPGLCMVSGCGKKALYAGRCGAWKRSTRGYCSAHKSLAVTDATMRQYEALGDYMSREGID